MPGAPKPDNERERLDALWSYEILDTAPEAAFDALTALAAELCDVPIATLTLVDETRQWFKSRCGFEGPDSTAREVAFCAYAILQTDILEVPDASVDPRFADNPLVTGDEHYRFYAGVPLIPADGFALGTLCVVDRKPRVLTQRQQAQLRRLAQAAVGLIALRIVRSEADDRRLALLDRSLTQARERNQQLSALRALSDALAAAREPADIVQTALSAALRLCRTDHGSIVADDAPARPGNREILTAQIRSRRTAGPTIVLSRDAQRPYSQSERVLLELIAGMAGLAIEGCSAPV
jgi:GAF domain-containing protein